MGFRSSFVDIEGASIEVKTVGAFDGCLGFVIVVHGHEAEASGSSGFPVRSDENLIHGAVRGKNCAHTFFGARKTQVSNVNLHNRLQTRHGTRGGLETFVNPSQTIEKQPTTLAGSVAG